MKQTMTIETPDSKYCFRCVDGKVLDQCRYLDDGYCLLNFRVGSEVIGPNEDYTYNLLKDVKCLELPQLESHHPSIQALERALGISSRRYIP